MARKNKINVLLLLTLIFSASIFAQRTIRIGYVDTEYILENVPEYKDASSQLNSKVQQWKSEIETRLNAIEEKRKQLNNESVLLTKELIGEREEEIKIEEDDVLDYQQKRFGPNGDLMIQKRQLMQPVQDQIFNAVQEIATSRKYDFVFDKSADVVMLYSADRYDISEQVLRSITRTSKRTQVKNRKEKKEAEDEDPIPEINEEQEARAKILADKKAQRNKAAEEKRTKDLEAREAKKKALEEKKQKIKDDRAKERQAKLDARKKAKEDANNNNKEDKNKTLEDAENDDTESKKKEERELTDKEKRQLALEEKKKRIVAERLAKLEARKKERDSIQNAKNNKDNN